METCLRVFRSRYFYYCYLRYCCLFLSLSLSNTPPTATFIDIGVDSLTQSFAIGPAFFEFDWWSYKVASRSGENETSESNCIHRTKSEHTKTLQSCQIILELLVARCAGEYHAGKYGNFIVVNNRWLREGRNLKPKHSSMLALFLCVKNSNSPGNLPYLCLLHKS